MSLASLFQKLTWPAKRVDAAIDDRISAEVKEKVEVATKAAVNTLVETIDGVAPMLGDLLSGEVVTLKVTHTVDIQLVKK